jgi:hypothetical protein
MSKIYLCRVIDSNVWESVTEFLFENRKLALNDMQDGPRYTDDFAVKDKDKNTVAISYSGDPEAIGQMVKAFSIREPAVIPGGFIREPSHVHIKGKSVKQLGFLLDLKTGTRYKVLEKKDADKKVA